VDTGVRAVCGGARAAPCVAEGAFDDLIAMTRDANTGGLNAPCNANKAGRSRQWKVPCTAPGTFRHTQFVSVMFAAHAAGDSGSVSASATRLHGHRPYVSKHLRYAIAAPSGCWHSPRTGLRVACDTDPSLCYARAKYMWCQNVPATSNTISSSGPEFPTGRPNSRMLASATMTVPTSAARR
jgi:hypothetical protein